MEAERTPHVGSRRAEWWSGQRNGAQRAERWPGAAASTRVVA